MPALQKIFFPEQGGLSIKLPPPEKYIASYLYGTETGAHLITWYYFYLLITYLK